MANVERRSFGATPRGEAELVVLRTGGLDLAVATVGAAVQSLRVADGTDAGRDVLLGYDDAAAYLADECFVGCVVGRYANRLADGRFVLDGREHRVPPNEGRHALHGGADGLHRQLWTVRDVGTDPAGRPFVELAHTSPDGHMGFPGRLEVAVAYTVHADGVRVDLSARTDAPTVVNLTQHAYFNLGSPDVRDLDVSVDASRYFPVDADGIPTGSAEPVAGTDLDLRGAGPVRRARDGVVDHCYLLDEPALGRIAVALRDPVSGWALELETDAPSVQLYTGEHLTGTPPGKHGAAYRPYEGVALEAQWPPDAPNHPDDPAYPPTVLRPGETWRSSTFWRVIPPA